MSFYVDTRTLVGGPGRRRVWCVCSPSTPVFFWFKSESDVRPLGRLSLTDATFNFDPHTKCQFVIRIDDVTHMFETEKPAERLKWLKQMQSIRRKHRGLTESTELQSCRDEQAQQQKNETSSSDTAGWSSSPAASGTTSSSALTQMLQEPECDQAGQDTESTTSTFYVSEDGQLNRLSYREPVPSSFLGSDVVDSIANDLIKLRSSEVPAPPAQRAAAPASTAMTATSSSPTKTLLPTSRPILNIRVPSFKHKPCPNCPELLAVINQLKTRCHDISDEVNASQNIIKVMQNSILTSKQQIEALQKMCELSTESDRIQFILDRERQLTMAQLECSQMHQQVQALQNQFKSLEAEHQQAVNDVDAYRESIKTKEELIMQLVNDREQTGTNTKRPVSQAFGNLIELDEPVEAVDITSSQRINVMYPADGINNLETTVSDLETVEQLRDLVQGFESQNLFLNQEILDLQATIRKLEQVEKQTERRNFDLEAEYYQLKSKYVLLLNHIQCDEKSRVLTSGNINDLVKMATTSSLGKSMTPEVEDTNNKNQTQSCSDVMSKPNDVYDSLGFFMKARKESSPAMSATGASSVDADLVNTAAQLHQKADDLRAFSQQEQRTEYIEWLQKWDSFLVTLSNKGITPSENLKHLVRTGIPHTYRTRVWTSLVNYWIKDITDDVGRGYYESLSKRTSTDQYDVMLKQIDLDLNRTLPGNRHFEDSDSDKMKSLRSVLYAYRYHNPKVGYCQGLNRLAAVALLYLPEDTAFWFVVACVDYLQPVDYYSQSLIGAIVDQKVLQDLVLDKLPRIAAQLRQFDVDLSLFTLSWFITCFVDALPHKVYLKIIDCFLYEQNKVLFRFALAILKVRENEILACRTAGALHSCLSHAAQSITDYSPLAQVAFNELNPMSHKFIDNRRQLYLQQMTVSGGGCFVSRL